MAKYFVEPYVTYYNKLASASSITSSASTVKDESDELLNTYGRLSAQVEGAMWQELGYVELASNSVPHLASYAKELNNNITTGLVVACNKSINELYPTLVTFKSKDEEYENTMSALSQAQEKIKTISSTKKDSKGNNVRNEEYYSLSDKITAYNESVVKLRQELEELKKSADDKVNDIKMLDRSITLSDITTSSEQATDSTQITEQEETKTTKEDTKETNEEQTTIMNGVTYSGTTGKTRVDTNCGSQEKGYSRIVYTSRGKVIKVFQQAWNENLQYASGGGLRGKGCGYNALASILTAVDSSITPEKVFKMGTGSDLYASAVKKIVENNYGIPVGYRLKGDMNRSDYYKKIAKELSKGNMVICTVVAGPDAKYTRRGHWVSLVDYDPATNQVWVTDSNDRNNKNAGPIDLITFLKNYEVNSNIVYLNDTSGYIEDCRISGKTNDTMLAKITNTSKNA